MSALGMRVSLKLRRIVRELVESPAERQWRQTWAFVSSVEGWLLEEEARWLFDTARKLPPGSVIVEIGSFKGRSTCCLAVGCGRRGRVFAVDTFDGGPNLPKANSLPAFTDNIEECGASSSVEPLVGMSGEIAKGWASPIDMLFIDGSHNYEDVLSDFEGFFQHVVPGGIVALHDVTNVDWPGVSRVWTERRHLLSGIGYVGSIGYGCKVGRAPSPSHS